MEGGRFGFLVPHHLYLTIYFLQAIGNLNQMDDSNINEAVGHSICF